MRREKERRERGGACHLYMYTHALVIVCNNVASNCYIYCLQLIVYRSVFILLILKILLVA